MQGRLTAEACHQRRCTVRQGTLGSLELNLSTASAKLRFDMLPVARSSVAGRGPWSGQLPWTPVGCRGPPHLLAITLYEPHSVQGQHDVDGQAPPRCAGLRLSGHRCSIPVLRALWPRALEQPAQGAAVCWSDPPLIAAQRSAGPAEPAHLQRLSCSQHVRRFSYAQAAWTMT